MLIMAYKTMNEFFILESNPDGHCHEFPCYTTANATGGGHCQLCDNFRALVSDKAHRKHRRMHAKRRRQGRGGEGREKTDRQKEGETRGDCSLP